MALTCTDARATPQVCCPVLLQTTTAWGAGAEERRDGGSVRKVQRRMAAWAVAQNGQSGYFAEQLHHACAQVRGCDLWLQRVGAKWHLDLESNWMWTEWHVTVHTVSYSWQRNITLCNRGIILFFNSVMNILYVSYCLPAEPRPDSWRPKQLMLPRSTTQ